MKSQLKKILHRESVPRKVFRFFKESGLEAAYGKKGMPCQINGKAFRILPRHRHVLAGWHDQIAADFFDRSIRPGSVCLNVGANVGLFALQFASWTGAAGKVIAFEPSPESAQDLRRHAAMNGLGDLIEVVEKAVSSHNGRAEFFASGTEQMNRLGSPNPLLSSARKLEIEMLSLDSFCAERALDPDWILIDIEGFEVLALKGARELIQRRGARLGLVVEMHPDTWEVAGTSRAELENLCAELQLQPEPLNGQKDCFADYGMVWLKPLRA